MTVDKYIHTHKNAYIIILKFGTDLQRYKLLFFFASQHGQIVYNNVKVCSQRCQL